MIIPAKFREDLGDSFILTKGLDNCLAIYSLPEWRTIEAQIRALPLSKSRDLQRFWFSGATEVVPDKQGRILIPANLRTYGILTRDVVVIGVSNRVEIWDKERWESQSGSLTSEAIADAMSELGF
jgi:MraZ protein